MNEIINVTLNENQELVVSARELHQVLEVTDRFSRWFDRMLAYGFEENIDYLGCEIFHTQAKTNVQDYIIKLDMAKEIAMLQRNEKSKQVRKYFIQVEKDFNSPEKIMARALLMADKKVHKLEAQIEADKPKVIFADAVSASHTSILVGDLAKLISQNGFKIGANRLFCGCEKMVI